MGVSMRIRVLVCAVSVLVAGCATTQKFEALLNGWVGSSELDLVRKLGPPQNSHELGGSRFLTYNRSRSIYLPGQAPSYTTTLVGNTAYTNQVGGYAGSTLSMSCTVTFEVRDERVRGWRWEGNDCKAM